MHDCPLDTGLYFVGSMDNMQCSFIIDHDESDQITWNKSLSSGVGMKKDAETLNKRAERFADLDTPVPASNFLTPTFDDSPKTNLDWEADMGDFPNTCLRLFTKIRYIPEEATLFNKV